jgi:aromatic-L-amino-acid decarboxylase
MIDFMDYGPQLSRSFKAFKVWAALRIFGVSAFREAVDHTLDLAGYLAERIRATPGLQLVAEPALTAVCFRIAAADDAGQAATIKWLADEGIALFGPARVDGRVVIRACITNYRTSREDVDDIVERLADAVKHS